MNRLALVTALLALLLIATDAPAKGPVADRENALRAAKSAYELIENNDDASDSELAQATYDYGVVLLQQYKSKESRKLLLLAQERFRTAYGEDSAEQLEVLLILAQAEYTLRRSRASERYLDEARALIARAFDTASIDYADSLHRIGRIAKVLSFPDAALRDLTRAHEIYVATMDPMSISLGQSNHILGISYLVEGRREEAKPYLNTALSIFDKSDPTRLERHIQVLSDWAAALDRQGLREEATRHYIEVGRLRQASGAEAELMPTVVQRVAPRYPSDALRRGVSGFVEWEFTVDEQGMVVNPEVVQLEGATSFKKASLDALTGFRYVPRFVDGEPVATPGVTTKITFAIER